MNQDTAARIRDLNHQFYQSFADDFSETRQRLQPGVQSLVERLLPAEKILDLGCGNGELASEFINRGFSGIYHGTDFSTALINKAVQNNQGQSAVHFSELDLITPSWDPIIGADPYNIILCFAVLHHIPGTMERLSVCKNIRKHISDQGRFFLSNWQFLSSKRFKKRIIPWSSAGFSEEEVDPGDYLLDWRRGGVGLRYVHHFSEDELTKLAHQAGFRIEESFHSDGAEGNLSIYQVWSPD
jgi:2-polyprenyl-3-methyl-5-hydroxy-6-metoxy-1,4-benzoquinol methylase